MYKITDGEYVKEGGELVSIEYIEALLQNVFLILSTQRGKFYPDKNFGSRIKDINKEPFEEYAAAYIRQALYDLDGVFVKGVEKDENEIKVSLTVNNDDREVVLPIENDI